MVLILQLVMQGPLGLRLLLSDEVMKLLLKKVQFISFDNGLSQLIEHELQSCTKRICITVFAYKKKERSRLDS